MSCNSSTTANERSKVGVVSLGCQKNFVDTEIMLGILTEENFEITSNLEEADLVLVNTCTFIGDAQEETKETLDELVSWKQEKPRRKVIVAGCHVQRYKEKLFESWPGIDGIIGVSDLQNFRYFLREVVRKESKCVNYTKSGFSSFKHVFPRIVSTPGASSYIKIAEGCSNQCSYCIIPVVRGPYRSRDMASVVGEAKDLAGLGIKEICLIAQDTGAYGLDIGRGTITGLLKRLCRVGSLEWIRLLYLYPEHITDELIDLVGRERKLCNYFDMPLQHIHGRVLTSMNRKGNKDSILSLICKLRERVPEVVLRTTFMIGFPGESEAEFEELLEFIKVARIDYAGFFAYSREEGTRASDMDGQIAEEIKQERLMRAIDVQQSVMEEQNRQRVGRTYTILAEGPQKGRYYGQAPEVDGEVIVKNARLQTGTFAQVKITGAEGCDLVGEVVA